MPALDQRRGDEIVLPDRGLDWMLNEGILTPTAFHVGKVVKLTERSREDDLTQVPEFIQWARLGAMLGTLSAAVKWWIGDWLAYGEGAWGDRYEQAANATGLDIGTLYNYAHVCRRVMPARRREELSFTAHARVAKLAPDEQTEWLEHAVENGLHSKELADAIREHGPTPPDLTADPDEPELETRPKATVYVDPQKVMAAARRVWRDAKHDGNGGYHIPADTFAQLATALGRDG